MKVIIANSVGKDEKGNHIVHFPSRWTASVGKHKLFTYYPYELAYLSSILKRDTPHEIKMVDGNFMQLDVKQYINILEQYQPDWLIMEPATLTYAADLQVALSLKRQFGTRVIFTGPHASAFPRETIADGVDYVCMGEYEYTVLDIINELPADKILGLYPNPSRPLLDVNTLPFPEDDDISRWNYINVAGSEYKEIEMFASRGCIMSCVFCVCRNIYYPTPNWRPRKVTNIIAEIQYLRAKYPGMEGIFFDEEEHNVKKEFILSLTTALKNNSLTTLKYNAMCGYWTLDEEMMTAMYEAGYYKLRIGIETASEIVAKAIHKTIDVPRLKNVLRIAKKIGLQMYGTFIIGAPGANKKEDGKTIGLIKELIDLDLLYDLQISICTPQPGTEFYRWADSSGFLINKQWRTYDGTTCAVVNYPKYSAQAIESMFRSAHQVRYIAFRNREIRRTGWWKFIKSKLVRDGLFKTLRDGISSLKKCF